jgi:glucosamine-6-phosphate deaminase
LQVRVLENIQLLGKAAAEHAAQSLRRTLRQQGKARIIAATGTSQFEFLAMLTSAPGIAWDKVEMFHLDEYVGLSSSHPASFCKYLRERLILPAGISQFHLLCGDGDVQQVMEETGRQIKKAPIDIAFVGIGENGHLAFNDPPADFDTESPYILVKLDEMCRLQQVKEGWFRSLAEVPERAVSMSIRQVLKAREIIAVVGGERKARAVRATLVEEISPQVPASILRVHNHTTLYLDRDSAALLDRSWMKELVKLGDSP